MPAPASGRADFRCRKQPPPALIELGADRIPALSNSLPVDHEDAIALKIAAWNPTHASHNDAAWPKANRFIYFCGCPKRCSKAEKLLRNLARRLGHDAPGVSGSILEGLDEILTVSRLGLPAELRRSLACTNIIENMNGTIRRVCRNVKHWKDASMALRWTGAAMMEAAKGFRRLKAYKRLPALRAALTAHQLKHTMNSTIEDQALAA
jgi:hypothetical protein